MNLRRNAVLALIGAMLATLTLGAQSGAAQPGDSKQIVTGETVAWTADWRFLPDQSRRVGEFEMVFLANEPYLAAAGGANYPVSAVELRDTGISWFVDSAPDSVTVIQEVEDATSAHALAVASTSDGGSFVIYSLSIEQGATTNLFLLVTPPDDLVNGTLAANGGITIDGKPPFGAMDPGALQQVIDQSIASPPTPTASIDEQIAEVITGQAGAEHAPGNPVASPAAESPAVAASLPNSATVASNGVEIRYSDAWAIDEQSNTRIFLETVQEPRLLVGLLDPGADHLGKGPMEIAQVIGSEIGLVHVVAATELDNGHTIIVLRKPDAEGDVYYVYDVIQEGGTISAFGFASSEQYVRSDVEFIRSTIRVDGDPVFEGIDVLVPELFGP